MIMTSTGWNNFRLAPVPDEYLRKLETGGELPAVLQRLKSVPQNPDKHPEGDVWNHTVLVVGAAHELAGRFNLGTEYRELLLLSALVHDLGKITTTTVTPEGGIRSWKHEQPEAFSPQYDELVQTWNIPSHLEARTTVLVQLHLPNSCISGTEPTTREVKTYLRRLAEVDLPFLVARLLVAADQSGRLRGWADPLEKWEPLVEELAKGTTPQPRTGLLITGSDLITLGFKPGPHFKSLLQKAEDLQKAGLTRDQIIGQLK